MRQLAGQLVHRAQRAGIVEKGERPAGRRSVRNGLPSQCIPFRVEEGVLLLAAVEQIANAGFFERIAGTQALPSLVKESLASHGILSPPGHAGREPMFEGVKTGALGVLGPARVFRILGVGGKLGFADRLFVGR